jgi:hypothetical protein
MGRGDQRDIGSERPPRMGTLGSPSRDGSLPEFGAETVVGSPEHLDATFARAAAAADRAVGLWLARSLEHALPDQLSQVESGGTPSDLRALRAMVRAAATAYARRLRDEGATPERMLVLVKSVTSQHTSPGFGAQELTSDIVRWSIEAYFDE